MAAVIALLGGDAEGVGEGGDVITGDTIGTKRTTRLLRGQPPSNSAERSNAPKVAGRRRSQRVEADAGQRPIPPARQTHRRDRTLGQFG